MESPVDSLQESVCRLVIEELGSGAWEVNSAQPAAASAAAAGPASARLLVQAAMAIKRLVRMSPSVAIISFATGATCVPACIADLFGQASSKKVQALIPL